MKLPRVLALAVFCVSLSSRLLGVEVNILEEGNFEGLDGGQPAGFVWAGFAGDSSVTPNSFTLVTEDSQFVRITVPPDTGKEVAFVKISETIPAPTDWTALDIAVRLRLRDYLQGSEGWHGVKVFVQFFDSNGEPLGAEVPAISVKEEVIDWTDFQAEVTIPPGTETFGMTVGFLGSAGEVDIDDLTIVPVK